MFSGSAHLFGRQEVVDDRRLAAVRYFLCKSGVILRCFAPLPYSRQLHLGIIIVICIERIALWRDVKIPNQWWGTTRFKSDKVSKRLSGLMDRNRLYLSLLHSLHLTSVLSPNESLKDRHAYTCVRQCWQMKSLLWLFLSLGLPSLKTTLVWCDTRNARVWTEMSMII